MDNHQHADGILRALFENIKAHQGNKMTTVKARYMNIFSYLFTCSFALHLSVIPPPAFYFFLITIAKPRSHWHTSLHIAHRIPPHSRRTWHLTSIQQLFHFSFSTCRSWATPLTYLVSDRSILAPPLPLRSKACPWLSRSKTRAGCPWLTPAGLKPQQTPKPDQKLHTWIENNGQSYPLGPAPFTPISLCTS